MATGQATFLPSNFVTPDDKIGLNPNWTQASTAQPRTSVLTEEIYSRLVVVQGRHPNVSVQTPPGAPSPYQGVTDARAGEVLGRFRFSNLALSQASGFRLEQATINVPLGGIPAGNARNLQTTLCGDFIDDNFTEPRRFVLSGCDMTVPLFVAGQYYAFNLTNFLPNGQNISYYRLADVVQYLINGLNNFMNNVIGDSSFVALLYVDAIGPRLFWYSTMFGQQQIRLFLGQMEGQNPNILNLILNHILVTDIRSGDTTQAQAGYPSGESMGLRALAQTGLQNNTMMMSIHCRELTQFRTSDTLAPSDGASLIATALPAPRNTFAPNGQPIMFTGTIKDGSLISPKIAFDRNQSLTEFEVELHVTQGTINQFVSFTATEIQNCQLLCVFRFW
jgi:hypothetical protein